MQGLGGVWKYRCSNIVWSYPLRMSAMICLSLTVPFSIPTSTPRLYANVGMNLCFVSVCHPLPPFPPLPRACPTRETARSVLSASGGILQGEGACCLPHTFFPGFVPKS